MEPSQKTTDPLSRALETIRRLKAQLDAQGQSQPIAVVGVGLRFPGGIDSLPRYWAALEGGQDLVRTLSAARRAPFAAEWESLPHKGGFLDDVLSFDAAFFGISPREARALDPQQRLLLEVAWEALEHGALPPDRLQNARAGVYVGITGQDYRDHQRGEPDAYWATGNGNCFAAGRLAYAMGLTGPAVAVDTACSSSLVAVHLAAQALRRGECDVALAGGVNLVLSPRSTRLVKETRSLSPDGLCKAFDARANGFTRGEGCGVIVLKRLDHALRDGDRVCAVIRGSAINQDGRSSGFTAPNVLAQISLLEAALADAGLSASDIGLVEAHGTGTALGDPIEMEALVHALGRKNVGATLHVGSVKTNFGHLEAAAGIAGLIKAILCVERGLVPPLVHFQTLNPRIDLSGTAIALPRELTAWERARAGSYAGVSSFGMSGTNAHVIIGPAPHDDGTRTGSEETAVAGFELSAKTPEALRALAARFAEDLAAMPARDYPAFAYTATFGRARHGVRARIEAKDREGALHALTDLAAGAASPAVRLLDQSAAEAELSVLPRRIAELSSYPWERTRHAPEACAEVQAAPPAPARAHAPSAPADVEHAPLYELVFRPHPATSRTNMPELLIAGDDTAQIAQIASVLASQGRSCTVLTPSSMRSTAGMVCGELPRDDAEWDALLRARKSAAPAVLLLAFRASQFPEQLGDDSFVVRGSALCAAITSAVRCVARAQPDGSMRAFALTRATRRVLDTDVIAASDHGLVNGLSPALGLELGSGWGGSVDLPQEISEDDVRALLAVVTDAGDEDVLAIRCGQAFAARLCAVSSEYRPELSIHADGTYLITGGLGGIGRALVSHIVARGAQSLLLIGRRAEQALSAEDRELLEDLRAQGVRVAYRAADCDDAQALAKALEALAELSPLRGVVHGAGVLAPKPLAEVDAESFSAALRGKVSGALWLHALTRAHRLDFFVQLSSVSALWGTEGYGAYGAANGGLDLLAGVRASLGLPAVSIAFGPWALSGLADATSRESFARMGVRSLAESQGCASFTASAPSAQLVACDVDFQRFVEVMSARRSRALFVELTAERQPIQATAETTSVLVELMALPERARPARLRMEVATHLARILGHADARAIREDAGFFDLGLDSIMAVDLTRDLSASLGTELKVADVFAHPSVAELADFVLARLEQTNSAVAPEQREAAQVPMSRPAARPEPRQAFTLEPHERASDPSREPIAIVGMAGRFPGADSVDELWKLLCEGRDAVSRVPSDRWDADALHAPDALAVGKITTDQGGFLTDIARFDAPFFHVPSREADSLDPQHRMLLEVAWHALEEGAIDPRSLKGTRTGVFVGISNSDYARLLERGGLEQLDAYFGTGTALNAAAGRIAYFLGLNGPALAVDTACSSSLVGLHLAVRSLRHGETDCAIAGGVNVIAAPSCSVAVSRAHMLSPEGRCKTFAADADGFVRAEGCGVLVLKRLSDARRDGNRVLAVIRGSAINQDGASSGLTVPSGKAQEAVIRAALVDAGVSGSAVSYLEAHGTGTSLGDPIELEAAWAALGENRKPGEPLHLGSIKSNIGHSESAAGMAGVIKTVLALRHRELPASIHAEQLNPRIRWSDMNVRVVDHHMPFRATSTGRLAGVSGFGFSGTNAHVILAEAEELERTQQPVYDAPVLLPLSAPNADGLERLAAAWRAHLESTGEAELASLAVTAASGRAHLAVRRAVLGKTRAELLKALSATRAAKEAGRAPRVALLFSGQGSQYFGMGRELYETEPVFRRVIDACDAILAPQLGVSLTELMFYGSDKERINQTRFTQPTLVALELALAELWASWGVAASAVMGHSVGEIAAAIHAGVMSLEAGLTLIAERARLMQGTERGAMLAVSATLDEVSGWLTDTTLDVAAINGPESIVVAGAPEAVDAFAQRMKARGVTARPLVVSHAFHSRLMEPILGELERAITRFEFRAPELPIVANLTGKLASATQYSAEYWCKHVREPVRFHAGAETLRALDIDVCLEVGPDRTLVNLITAAGLLPTSGGMPSLRRGLPDRLNLLGAAKHLYEVGQDLVWSRVQAASGGQPMRAPLYPFAPEHHWTKIEPVLAPSRGASQLERRHWGEELRSPALSGRVFAFERSAEFPRYLTDHRLYGTVVTPAASHLGTMLSALGAQGRAVMVQDLVCPRALVIKDGEEYPVQLVVSEASGTSRLTVQSLLDAERDVWQTHLEARLAPNATRARHAPPEREAFQRTADRHISGEAFYRYFRELGYTLGPSFCWIADVWIRGDEALVRYRQPTLPDDVASYEIYPGLIDSCFQSIAGFMVDEQATEAPSLAIPFAAAELSFHGRPTSGTELWGHVRVTKAEPLPRGRLRVEMADLHMFAAEGHSIFNASEFRVRHAPRSVLEQSLRAFVQQAYVPTWVDAERTERTPARVGKIALITDARDALEPLAASSTLARALEQLGLTVTITDELTDDVSCEIAIDVRFVERAADVSADESLAAALSLASTLKNVPREVPYAVLASAATEAAPVRESLWGLMTALEAEHADRRLLRITIEPGVSATAQAEALLDAWSEDFAETRLLVTSCGVKSLRLEPVRAGASAPSLDGSVLITGGLGALGLSVASILAKQGVRAITLMARSQPDATAQAVIDALRGAGTGVTVVSGDVTDAEACARAVRAAKELAPLSGVFHLAGVSDDHAFERLSESDFDKAFAAKCRGASTLTRAVEAERLACFVLFSSVASALGSAGQVNYAAANGYLDGFVHTLRARGIPATSVNWGPWVPSAKGGMAASEAVRKAAERMGLRPLTDAEAAPLLLLAASGAEPRLVAVAADFDRYSAQLAGHPRARLVSRLTGATRHEENAGARAKPKGFLREELEQVAAEAREDALCDAIRALVHEVLGDAGAFDDHAGFAEMGVDSIMAIDLRSRLAHALGIELPATIAIDHPSVAAMARYAVSTLFPAQCSFAREEPARAAPPAAVREDLDALSLEQLISAVQLELSAGQ